MAYTSGNLALQLAGALDDAGQKPAVRDREGKPARMADFGSEAIVRASQADGPTPAYRAERDERWIFLRMVAQHKDSGECDSYQDSAKHVAIFHADSFDIITDKITGSKAYRNWNSWKKLLGKKRGRIDWENRDALLPKYKRGKQRRYGADEFWLALAGYYEHQNQLSMAEAYELTRTQMRRDGFTGPMPTLGQVEYWYQTPAVRMRADAARFGEEWRKNKLISHVRRDWSNVEPNEMWIGDHHVFDCAMKVWNEAENKWEAKRPWLTAWIDARSLYMVGWVIRWEDPSSLAILEGLRDGMLRNAMHCSRILLTDQGKDYKLTGFTQPFATSAGVEMMCITDMGATARRSEAYRARTKTVERVFGVVCGTFSKRWGSYLGNEPGKRPDIANYYWKTPEELPSLGEFTEAFSLWLEESYHCRQSKGRILDGRAPEDVWQRGTGGPELSIDELRRGLAVPIAERTIRAGGVMEIKGVRLRGRKLAYLVGTRAVVRLDRVNGFAWAYDLQGQELCELEIAPDVPAIAKSEAEFKLLGRELKRQREEEKALKLMIDLATAGTYGLAPADRMQLDSGRPFEVEARGSVGSVKGPAHRFKHLAAVQDGQSTSFAENVPERETPEPAAQIADPSVLAAAEYLAESAETDEPEECRPVGDDLDEVMDWLDETEDEDDE